MRDDETGWVEADVIINGQRLSFAESMTVRVAISSFRMFVNNPDTAKQLGGIAEGYEHTLAAIENLLVKTK